MAVKKYSKTKEGHLFLSKDFKVSEFACKDGSDAVYIDDNLVIALQKIRTWAGAAVCINSGFRTTTYNAKIGGVTNSYHTKGQAADISVKNKTPDEVAAFAETLGMKGIGCYDKNNGYFTHIDTRESKFFWRNSSCTYEDTFLKGTSNAYTVGNYEVNTGVLNVRAGAGTSFAQKKFSQLTTNAQKQIKNLAGKEVNGYIQKMVCSVYQISGNWGKTPSGWICLDYCKKCVS